MWFINIETVIGEQSTSKNLTCRDFLNLILPNRRARPLRVAPEVCKKQYEAPVVRKLTLEQAKLLLIGHATIGDQGASDLMDVVFSDPSDFSEPRDKATA